MNGGLVRKRLHQIGAVLAVVVVATGGVSIAGASPASAAVTCGPSAPDRDPNDVQIVNREASQPTGVAMRTGPGTNCGLIVRVPWGAWGDLNCYRLGESVHGYTTWSAVHYAQYFGWINDYYLRERDGQKGSTHGCA